MSQLFKNQTVEIENSCEGAITGGDHFSISSATISPTIAIGQRTQTCATIGSL